MQVSEEIGATPGGLIRVAIIAALAFSAMAWLLDEQFRPLAIIMGAVFLVLIAIGLIHLRLQRRFGTATLIAEGPFDLKKPFAGTIVTELREVPGAPLRLRIGEWSGRQQVTIARTTVDPMLLRRGPDGSLVIPFHILPPEDPGHLNLREARLHVRTLHWPIGWGATFLIAENP